MRNERFKTLVFETLNNFSENVKDLQENWSNTFKVIASSEDIDRSGEIIKVNGWDDQNYKKNPVILSNHSYKVQDIVWKMTKIYKEWKNLIVEWIFTEKTEMWKTCKDLYNAWFLKTVSVWFLVKKRHEENRKIIEEAELLEISFVAVPCNPNAVSLDKKVLEKWLELWILKEISDLTNFWPLSEKELEIVSKFNDKIEKLEKRISNLENEISENKKIFETLALGKKQEEEKEINIGFLAEDIVKNLKLHNL